MARGGPLRKDDDTHKSRSVCLSDPQQVWLNHQISHPLSPSSRAKCGSRSRGRFNAHGRGRKCVDCRNAISFFSHLRISSPVIGPRYRCTLGYYRYVLCIEYPRYVPLRVTGLRRLRRTYVIMPGSRALPRWRPEDATSVAYMRWVSSLGRCMQAKCTLASHG